ncbi:MAG: TRAP transporter large permease subunit [Planctomycetes bacterium]|nr:TRAP transporter large permease subunit [Planctomycetota bacterium]
MSEPAPDNEQVPAPEEAEAPPGAELIPAPVREVKGWRGWLRWSEDVAVSLVLAVMVLLPLTEILLRKVFHRGIDNASALLQHGTLLVGMLGGALAARERRLISLSTLTAFLHGRWKKLADVGGAGCAAAVSAFLAVASWQLVQEERTANTVLAYGLPVWVIQLVMPLGFGLVALRLVWHVTPGWKGRVLALVLALVTIGLCLHPPRTPEDMVVPSLIALFIATLLGAPVFTTLGGAALILNWGSDSPIASVPTSHYSLVTNATLPTIPLFTLAGYFLAEGGASKRLVRVFQALVGGFRGGPAIVTALVCAFFTSFTGASGVTILALGGLLMPVLLAAGYKERNALGLLTGAGSLGLLFPPCLPLILYAIVANANFKESGVTIEKMFLGGIGPGLFLVGLTAAWGIWCGPRGAEQRQPFAWREAKSAVWEAKWELLLPVVALWALFGGFATPVEAAAVTALYAFFTEVVIYRDLGLRKDIPRVMTECGLLVGGVLLILGVAVGFTNYLVLEQIPDKLVEWTTHSIHSKYTFLLMLNVFLLLVGCLMDIFSAIVVVVPLIVPIGKEFGVDPIHLGIVFLANLELGYLTPPVGMNLFLSSYRFKKPMPEVVRAVLPMLFVLLIGVLLITYIPPLTTFLPGWLG